MTEIAYDYGFESHDVFGRAFKLVYGITPENYRRGRFLLPTFHAVNLALQQKGAKPWIGIVGILSFYSGSEMLRSVIKGINLRNAIVLATCPSR
ncbi:AraC family transcriptional regulator [Paenibacillus sp. CAU 1523]|uniref:AraC family transcriptional regulator n=1 Tax=Paenibacillus arenosi TaxID=2774142 RepID=A0ABR9AT42_9BACL|nr:AraC family transcriptional regulator [Paenibacillus arenosi]